MGIITYFSRPLPLGLEGLKWYGCFGAFCARAPKTAKYKTGTRAPHVAMVAHCVPNKFFLFFKSAVRHYASVIKL